MTWIGTVEEEAASDALAGVYNRIKGARGKLSNIMKAQSLHPKAMSAHVDLYTAIMFGRSGLSREEREMIAVAVSGENGCAYCVHHHAAALEAYWKDTERVDRFAAAPLKEESGGRMGAVLDYAILLTRSPSAVEQSHIAALREVGLGDDEILSVNLITSYFNFVNRIAEGLGVEFTPDEAAGYRY